MADDPLKLWGLDDTALAVYETVLADPGRTIAELAAVVERPAEQIGVTLAELASLGLVQLEDGARVRARPPSVAVVKLARARLRAVAEDAARAGELIASIDRVAELEPLPPDGTEHRLVHATDLVRRWQRVMAAAATDSVVESLSVIPDMSVLNSLPANFCEEFFELLKTERVRLRCIVAADQLAEMRRSECAGICGADGALFRAARSLPGWFYVVGTSCAGIPRIWGRSPPADTLAHCLITEPGSVAALRALFEEVWRRAMPVRGTDRPPPRDHRSVFCLLAQGQSDETVARTLGISVRTVRARVAEAMAELGAHTRFEAAVEAARNGWFD